MVVESRSNDVIEEWTEKSCLGFGASSKKYQTEDP